MSCGGLPFVMVGSRAVLVIFTFTTRDATGALVAVDLTGAQSPGGLVFANFEKPSGATVRVELAVLSASDGTAAYVSEAGFFGEDEVGEWQAQGFAQVATGQSAGFFPSVPVAFEARANLPGVGNFNPTRSPDPVPLLVSEPGQLRVAS